MSGHKGRGGGDSNEPPLFYEQWSILRQELKRP